MRISDWSSDVCSSDLPPAFSAIKVDGRRAYDLARKGEPVEMKPRSVTVYSLRHPDQVRDDGNGEGQVESITLAAHVSKGTYIRSLRSEEHTSELQSLMRNSYAVFCLKKKNTKIITM